MGEKLSLIPQTDICGNSNTNTKGETITIAPNTLATFLRKHPAFTVKETIAALKGRRGRGENKPNNGIILQEGVPVQIEEPEKDPTENLLGLVPAGVIRRAKQLGITKEGNDKRKRKSRGPGRHSIPRAMERIAA